MRSLLLIALLALASTLPAAETPYLDLPAQGIFDMDEGTIEFWFKPGYDPQEAHPNYLGRASILAVLFGDPAWPTDGLSIGNGTQDAGRRTPTGRNCLMRLGITVEGQDLRHPLLPSIGHDLKRDTWVHFAAAWRGKNVWVYVNGKRTTANNAPDMTYERAPRVTLTPDARLCIGGWPKAYLPSNMAAIDDLRISSVARPPAELGASGPLKPDRHTLFLMSFDSLDKASLSIDAAATSIAARPLNLPANMSLIPGKFGLALSLNRKAFPPPAP